MALCHGGSEMKRSYTKNPWNFQRVLRKLVMTGQPTPLVSDSVNRFNKALLNPYFSGGVR